MSEDRRRWTREPPDVRRQQLLDAARSLLIDRGYDAMTVAAVAERAGVGKGTVYLYFGSKVELLEGLQALFWDGMMEAAREGVARRARSWSSRWRHMLEDLVAYGVHNDELFHALYGGSPTTDIESHDILADIIADLLRRQQEAGAADPADIETTSRFIVSAFRGMGSWLVHSPSAQRRARISHMLTIIERTIGAS